MMEKQLAIETWLNLTSIIRIIIIIIIIIINIIIIDSVHISPGNGARFCLLISISLLSAGHHSGCK